MSQESDEVFGLEVVVADPCRCGCPLLRVHPHSTKIEHPNLEMCLVSEAARKTNRD